MTFLLPPSLFIPRRYGAVQRGCPPGGNVSEKYFLVHCGLPRFWETSACPVFICFFWINHFGCTPPDLNTSPPLFEHGDLPLFDVLEWTLTRDQIGLSLGPPSRQAPFIPSSHEGPRHQSLRMSPLSVRKGHFLLPLFQSSSPLLEASRLVPFPVRRAPLSLRNDCRFFFLYLEPSLEKYFPVLLFISLPRLGLSRWPLLLLYGGASPPTCSRG